MATKHTVKQGECISSIAAKYGLFPETIWEDPANAELKERREDPNVLAPGDVVVIPDKRIKEERVGTDKRHRFRKKGVPELLRLRLLDEDGEPLANEPYLLSVEGTVRRGTTDGDGVVTEHISPDARSGRLVLLNTEEEYRLALGHLDPLDSATGVQDRLNNLGFTCGSVDGVIGPKTQESISYYREVASLAEGDGVDREFLDHIASQHGA